MPAKPEKSSDVSFESLLPRMRALEPTLSAGPRRVASYILADPGAASRLTIAQLASATSTSDATIIRLANQVGCSGYKELRLQLAAADAATVANGHARVTPDIRRDDPAEDVIAKLASEEQAAIAETAACLDPAGLTAIARRIVGARRTVLVGVGASGLVALDLDRKLERIGLIADAALDAHQALTLAVLLGPGDVMIGISASGTTADVIEPMEVAQSRGAHTIAITSRPGSRIADADDVLLSVASHETSLRPAAMASRTGQLFVVDALFTVVAQHCFDTASRAIHDSYEALVGRHTVPSRRAHDEDATTDGDDPQKEDR
ncbi:MurR/RpiR family transcriptional regulator [Nigerium massiliense]|uniref:MurR/RpiR family transcriptional regulator n=1 Tax=Nigerium massiliense TaxID=1522317 RepID=UPI000694AAD6|nr:MurR/RpiR family transcriptional regulator [Nigerium massiliense]